MSLAAPHPGLRACVVVPAKDEEALVGRCLHALATQTGIDADASEVILVLDACRDRTAAAALSAAACHGHLRLHLRDGPGRGVGAARRVGMDIAAARLRAVGRPHGLIVCTDADTVVDPSWLAVQLELSARGALAIGGRIDILPDDLANLSRRAIETRALSEERRRVAARARGPGVCDHGWFSGASMSVTASLYGSVGGLEPIVALEDESLERALTEQGVAIVRSDRVRVRTSGRLHGRAPLGLAHDLAASG
jgi:glycosyltransferase involved in cell wall biosynthesis